MQVLSYDGLSRAYREDKSLQAEYSSLYEYMLHECAGDFDLFDNQIEVKELFIREHNEEIRNLNTQIKELRMKEADQVVKDFFDELKTRKGQKVTVVVNYKPGMHPIELKNRPMCGDHSECCNSMDWDDDEGYPPFITEVITGQACVVIRGKDKSAYVRDGETAIFWNRFNDHPDYYYYESKIHGFQSESDARHYDYLEDRFHSINSIRFMFENDAWEYEDTKLSDQIDWYAGERIKVINNLLTNFLGKNKKYPVEIVHRHELQETLEDILDKIKDKDKEETREDSYYQWNLVRDALDDYFAYEKGYYGLS
jgi:hypothetical protein